MSTDPGGGFFGGPVATPPAEPWAGGAAVPGVPGPRPAYEPPTRAQVPVTRKRTSYERTRMVVGSGLILVVIAIVVVAVLITDAGSKQSAHVATSSIDKAGAVVLKSDLANAATAEATALATSGTYTASMGQLRNAGFIASSTDTVRIVSASATHYCLSATSTLPGAGTLYLDSARGVPSTAPCR